MKKILLSFFLVFALGCKNDQQKTDTAVAIQIKDSLANTLRNDYKKGFFKGLGVAISDASDVKYSEGFGFADMGLKNAYTDETLQTVGSVSKTFIGLALLKAQDLGKLKLEEDATHYLPFLLRNPRFPDAVISIRNIATHTSGIQDTDAYLRHNYVLYDNGVTAYGGDEVMNSPNKIEYLPVFLGDALFPGGKYYTKEAWGNYKPGSKYAYSNFGAAIAAYVIEQATGMQYHVFVEKYILIPLGMTHTCFNISKEVSNSMSTLFADSVTAIKPYHLITYPDGGLASNAREMGLYLRELIKGYKGTGVLLKPQSYKEYFKQYLTADNFIEPRSTKNPYSDEYNSGLFIAHTPAGFIGHTGGDPGVASMLYFDPKTAKGYFIMVNTGINSKQGMKCFYSIYNTLVDYSTKM